MLRAAFVIGVQWLLFRIIVTLLVFHFVIEPELNKANAALQSVADVLAHAGR